ncbi:hypothetical protein Tco_1341428, partial [Tanacetum coccineum]
CYLQIKRRKKPVPNGPSKDRYQYEATVDLKEARKVWVTRSMERCRGTWAIVRKKCESKSQSNNPANWKIFRPEFVNIEADWDGILDS